MKKTSVITDEVYEKLSPAEWIAALFAKAETGAVTVCDEQNCDDFRLHGKEKDPRPLSVSLAAGEGERDRILREEKEIREAMRAFAAKEDLNAAQRQICERFFSGAAAAFDPDGAMEAAFGEGGEKALLQKQKELLDAHRAKWEPEARRRLGGTPFAYALLLRARRLYELFRLNAPACVTNVEEKLLAEALVFHRCGTKTGRDGE